jgi:hypothetical protein
MMMALMHLPLQKLFANTHRRPEKSGEESLKHEVLIEDKYASYA